jgi:GTP-binding protein
MGAYDPGLPARPSLVVGTKADLVEAGEKRMAPLGPDASVVSAVTGQGIAELRLRLASFATDAIRSAAERESHVILRPGRPRFTVKRDAGGRFHVRGRTVERWVMETDLDDADEVAKLQARLIKEGVERKLASMGAREGDEVEIRGHVFDYIPEPSKEDG